MADTITPIAFSNGLTYDVIVYDSFDNDDDDRSGNETNGTSSDQTYFATLTQLGIVPAGKTVSIQPIHDSSSFVLENAANSKPVKRFVALSFDDISSFSLTADDDAAMTQTFQFIAFFLNNPNDPISTAFTKVLTGTDGDQATNVDNFFGAQPAYSKCNFEDYMMALAYAAEHPAVLNPSQPSGSSSLNIIARLLGGKWPDGLSDIYVTKFSCTTKDNRLVVTFEVDINTLPFENDLIAANVRTLLTGTTLVKAQLMVNFQIGLNIFGIRLSILLDAVAIPIDDGKTLNIKKPIVSIDINPLFKFVVFTMQATFPFNINGKTFDAVASFVIDNDEAAIGVDIQGDHSSLPPPPGIKGLHFDEFGVGMGMFFKPPGFSVGIQGKFHIGDTTNTIISLDDDTFALVCEYLEEAIEPKYVAFSVPQLSLNQVIELFTNANPNIDVPVAFSDLSFHWSDGLMDCVVLPDGSLSPGGYGFTAAVNIFSFGFYGAANLDINNGLTADVEVSPINWNYIFQLTGDGKGYSVKIDAAGNPVPNNFVPTTQAEKDAIANATTKQIVRAGGPSLVINTLSMPILHLNAKASLFELASCDITADVNKSGISFLLDYGVVLKEKMSVTLADWHNLSAAFVYGINQTIKVPALGSFQLTADVNVHFGIATTLSTVTLSVGGGFDFWGLQRTFGDFNADINIRKVADLLTAIGYYIAKNAKQIFSDILNDAVKWASYVKAGLITAYDEVGTTLKNVWNMSTADAAKIMKQAGYAIDDIGRNLKDAWNCTGADLATALKAAGYTASEVGATLKNLYNAASNDVAAALKLAGYTAQEVSQAIKDCWNCSVNDLAWAMMYVGYGVADIVSTLKAVLGAAAQDVAAALKNLGFVISDIGKALQNVYNLISQNLASILKNVGYDAADVAAAIQQIWTALANLATDVASKAAFLLAAGINGVAAVLKAAGYVATDVASALKTAFNVTVDAVAAAMKAVGYGGSEVKGAFETLGGDFKDFAETGWEKFTDPDTWNPSKW